MVDQKFKSLREQRILEIFLKELRKKSGLRQVDVASSLGIPQSMVSKYEAGERRVDVLEVREICHLFGISLLEFVEELEKRLEGNDETD